MNVKLQSSISAKLLLLQCLFMVSAAQDFDFFYFVQQWPGSYCDTQKSCCFPTTGKPPSDFGIHGLWPNRNDGSYPSNCDPGNSYDESKISDLIGQMQHDWATLSCPSNSGTQFWSHEWNKHGTCSESTLDQHAFFSAALNLKSKVNLLQALQTAGIKPDGGSYDLSSIKSAISNTTGYDPYVECNEDENGNSQLYQVYVCVDASGSGFIECPVFPRGRCGSSIEFPKF